MGTRCRDIRVHRCGFNQRDVAQVRGSCPESFIQVMAEQAVFGDAALQRIMHRLHMDQSFAAEAAMAENILVDFGTACVVDVHTPGAGKQAAEEGHGFAWRQW